MWRDLYIYIYIIEGGRVTSGVHVWITRATHTEFILLY